MARKHFLINRHTPNQTGFPSDLKLGEIAVRHNENAPELIINLLEDGDESDFRTFIDKVAIEKLFETFNTNLSGEIDSLSGVVEAHIEAVETKFEDYDTTEISEGKIEAAKNEAIGAASGYTDAQVKSAKEALNGLITGVDSKVDTLIGDDSGVSVRNIAANEVAKVVANAPESFDTLKEIADWIGTASGVSAATLVADIEALKKANGELSESIQGVDSKVDTLAESAMTEIERRAIKTEVDTLVANTSAATYNAAYGAASGYTDAQVKSAKEALSETIQGVTSRVESLESLSAATQSAIQTIDVSGVSGVKVTKSGTSRTIDFSEMLIDCGEF